MKLRKPSEGEILRLKAIADYQFGWPAGDLLFPHEDQIVVGVSPSTRRIREVYDSEGLIAVLRAHDYYYSLSLLGADRLRKGFPPPRLRVVVKSLREKTKTIFTHDIIEVDTNLKAGDEVIIVDPEDRLLGVGRLRLSPADILSKVSGEAVRVRKLVRR